MPITTTHQYIDSYPIHPDSKRLILGTIHPHSTANFNIDFFYGNVGSFWDILQNAFPDQGFRNKAQILRTLRDHRVSITDMIRRCDRADDGVSQDEQLFNIVTNGPQIREGIKNSKIEAIYFTSRFGKNNAGKLFIDTFHIPYTLNRITNEFVIPAHFFGRPIRAIALYSPSNNANVGISKSAGFLAKATHYKAYPTPVKQFKIDFYRDKFAFFNEQVLPAQ